MRPTGKRRGPTEEVRQVWVIRLRSHCAQFRYPQLQCMRMPYTAHTCVDPISAKPSLPTATMAAYAASASGLLQSTHVYNNRLTPTVLASNTHAHDLRTVWHGLRAITAHTVPPSVVVSVPHYNGTIPRSLHRSMLRAVTFDARFSVYRTPKIEEQATAPGHPPPAGLEDARPPDRPSN